MVFRILLLIVLYSTLAFVWERRLESTAEAPQQDAVERQPRLERLTRYLMKVPPEVMKPILLSIALMPDDRLARVDAWLRRPPADQLRELTVQDSPMLQKAGSLRDSLLLGWLGQEYCAPPFEAHLMICAAGDRLDDQMRNFALQSLSARALKAGDHETALRIMERAVAVPGATWSVVKGYLQRASERELIRPALSVLDTWLRRHEAGSAAREVEEAREMQCAFMLRSSLAAEALDIQVQALKAVPVGQALPESVLQRAVTAARAAGTPRIILPLLEQHLACFEEHQVSPSQLLIKEDASADYHHWLAEYVTFAEAVLPAVRSYEACQRLAAIGEGSALARVCALAEPAGRMDDAVLFLEQVLANALLRPVLLSLTGVQPLAKRVVLQAMKKAPGDRDLHYAATLAEAAAAPGSAAGLWQAYLRRFPEDAPASRRLIQAHLNARQPTLALRVLDGMKEASLTEADRHQRELLRQL